ncbi:hypothetical protein A0H81_05058 [Grifola frondosa]|uniref:Uncharacterized protein n=1 Tax=Grifola frondosa TaxID=5627 RepID=A0A1C7MCX2_GRIFR|nr:hypothetical protein A0H81_05058 [Grifola frondosa]
MSLNYPIRSTHLKHSLSGYFLAKPWQNSSVNIATRPPHSLLYAWSRSYLRPKSFENGSVRHAVETLDPQRLTSADFVDLSGSTCTPIWDIRALPRRGKKHTSASSQSRMEEPRTQGETLQEAFQSKPRHGALPRYTRQRSCELRAGNGPDGAERDPMASDAAGAHAAARDPAVAPPARRARLGGVLERCVELADRPVTSHGALVHALGQPFPVAFDKQNVHVHLVARDSIFRLGLGFPFCDSRSPARQRFQPYAGAGLCCFERSTLPQHRGTRTVVFRVVKIVEPVRLRFPEYDGYVSEPREGSCSAGMGSRGRGMSINRCVVRRTREFLWCLSPCLNDVMYCIRIRETIIVYFDTVYGLTARLLSSATPSKGQDDPSTNSTATCDDAAPKRSTQPLSCTSPWAIAVKRSSLDVVYVADSIS